MPQNINISKINIAYVCFKSELILNPLGQNVYQWQLKSMPEIIYSSMKIKQLSKQHGKEQQVGNCWTGLFLNLA